MVIITQLFSYFPMPVGTNTIAPAVPNAKHKPGEGSEGKCDQMNFSCLSKNPPHHIEYSKCCVKNKEENIQELVQHLVNIKR